MLRTSSRATAEGTAKISKPGATSVHGYLQDEKAQRLRGRWQVSNRLELNMNAEHIGREMKERSLVCHGVPQQPKPI